MQSIGERLEEARKRKGVTIREAAEATKIRGDYLNSFENNNFTISVPDIYVRGFLRSYSSFLKLNSEKIITDYNANLIGEAKAAKREHREFFGRMEIQQAPLVAEEEKSAPPATAPLIDDDALRAEEDLEDKPGILDKIKNVDKEVAIKIGIVVILALLLIMLVVWIFKALTSGGAEEPVNQSGLVPAEQVTTPQETAASSATQSEPFHLIATGDVRVSVIEVDTGRVLLDSHPMMAGARETIQKSGKIRIEYTEGANLQVQYRGQTLGTGRTGASYNTIP